MSTVDAYSGETERPAVASQDMLSRYLAQLTARWRWFIAIASLMLGLAIYIYASASDGYRATALLAPQIDRPQGMNPRSLSGLAALASGSGQEPSFQEFSALLASDTVIRRALPQLSGQNFSFMRDYLTLSRSERWRRILENAARSLFGKPPRLIDREERLITALQSQIKIKKTPENYIEVSIITPNAAAAARIVDTLIKEADSMVRQRARANYNDRASTFRLLLDQETRPDDRLVLTSLLTYEYQTFVAAQSSASFAYSYIDAPTTPERVYSTSFLVLVAISLFLAVAIYLGGLFLPVWLGRW